MSVVSGKCIPYSYITFVYNYNICSAYVEADKPQVVYEIWNRFLWFVILMVITLILQGGNPEIKTQLQSLIINTIKVDIIDVPN